MSEAKGDPRVTEVQEWLNETYGAQSWFTKLTVDGMTGAGTCKALCKALQYEIGVKNVDGVIGAGTLAVSLLIHFRLLNLSIELSVEMYWRRKHGLQGTPKPRTGSENNIWYYTE